MVMAVLAAILLPITGQPASANNFSGASGVTTDCSRADWTEGVNMQDPNPHTFFYSSLEPTTATSMDHARNAAVEPTGVDTQMVSSSTSVTDVVAFDQDYVSYCFITWDGPLTSGTVGLEVCVGLTSNNKCERAEVRYDLSYMNVSSWTARRNVACHEVGHTLGLIHRDGSCIQAGYTGHENYNEHDVAHINGGPFRLYGGQTMFAGWQLKSWDGRWTLIQQDDGNLVLRDPTWFPRWASDSCCWPGSGIRATMQTDGNLVLRWPNGAVACHTDTWRGPDNSYLEVQTDGNLVIYGPNREVVAHRFNGTLTCRP
ncbi:MAG TPA: hypothetical protein VHF47_14210 [Acidimicrobiales bacterium]|nr:hypothetical protein [Acidimicrobiales bacterium]